MNNFNQLKLDTITDNNIINTENAKKDITVKELLIINDLLKYAVKYNDFIKLFNRKIHVITSYETMIWFKYRETEYKSKSEYNSKFKCYCSTVYKANKSTNYFFYECKCNTRNEELNYPVIAGYIATCLNDRQKEKH